MTIGQPIAHVTNELIALTNADSLEDALCQLRIIKPHHQRAFTVEVEGWTRGGSETYILPFKICTAFDQYHLILKACVISCIGRSVDSVIDTWKQRRDLLEHNGLRAPHFYGYKDGVLLEEFIPERLLDVLSEKFQERIFQDLANIYGTLGKLGFHPIRILEDLRMKGEDIYFIDFGLDLGNPSNSPTHLWEFFKNEIKDKLQIDFEPASWDSLHKIYQEAFSGNETKILNNKLGEKNERKNTRIAQARCR